MVCEYRYVVTTSLSFVGVDFIVVADSGDFLVNSFYIIVCEQLYSADSMTRFSQSYTMSWAEPRSDVSYFGMLFCFILSYRPKILSSVA